MKRLLISIFIFCMVGCAAVDVTKTAKGFYEPTNASDIDILKTKPDQKFVELGTVTVTGFDVSDSAKMHNAIRTKSAPLGATAVILTDEGITQEGWFKKRWATGVAIRYQ